MITDINSEDRLVQQTFAEHLEKALGWKSVCVYNAEIFGPAGTLAGASKRDVVLALDLGAAIARLILNIQVSPVIAPLRMARPPATYCCGA